MQFGADCAIPGDAVELFIDDNDTPVATADADSFGSVDSFHLDVPVSAGYHTAYLKSVDGQGIESDASTQSRFYVRPAAPTITSPASTLDRDAYVNTQPTFTVTGVDAGATVDLYETDDQGDSGDSLASVSSTLGGTVTLTASSPVTPGDHRFVVTQTVTEGTGGNEKLVASDWIGEASAETRINLCHRVAGAALRRREQPVHEQRPAAVQRPRAGRRQPPRPVHRRQVRADAR